MPRRKRLPPKAPIGQRSLSAAAFDAIVADAPIPKAMRSDMHADLAIAFDRFHSEVRTRQFRIKPNELIEDLKQIERLAGKLAKLLQQKREAADVMLRVACPEYDTPQLFASPTGPPRFAGLAVKIEMAARRARETPPKNVAYVDPNRRNVALDTLLERLLDMWVKYAGVAPTFGGEDEERLSPFVRFSLACCKRLELRPTASALAKRAARVYTAKPGPKPLKRRPKRGSTRRSTGHVVRGRRGITSRD